MNKCITIKDLYRQVEEPACFESPDMAVHAVLGVTEESDEQLEQHIDRWVLGLKAKQLLLSLQDVDVFALADPDAGKRSAVCERVLKLLEKLGDRSIETQLILPADIGSEGGRLVGTYEDLFNAAYESMSQLVQTAEVYHIMLSMENPGERLFLSPLELRDFIDQINNAYMGVCFHPIHASRLGDPYDWFDILGPRIHAVRIFESKRTESFEQMKYFLEYLAKRGYDRPVLVVDTERV